MGHLCWKSDRVCYLFTLELPVSTEEKAVISRLINAPLWNTPSDCSRSLSLFLCIWTKQRLGRWTVCLPGSGSVLFSAVLGPGQEGDVGTSSSSSTGWICVDSGLPLSHPVLIPLHKLCCGTLESWSSVHWFITNHPSASLSSVFIFFHPQSSCTIYKHISTRK